MVVVFVVVVVGVVVVVVVVDDDVVVDVVVVVVGQDSGNSSLPSVQSSKLSHAHVSGIHGPSHFMLYITPKGCGSLQRPLEHWN